jgi:hypothetical protein
MTDSVELVDGSESYGATVALRGLDWTTMLRVLLGLIRLPSAWMKVAIVEGRCCSSAG